MPFCHHVSPDDGFALIRMSGSVFGSDVVGALTTWLRDQEWEPQFVALWDLYEVDQLVLVPEDVRAFTAELAILRPMLGSSRTAAIARRELVFMAANLYAAQAMDLLVDHEVLVPHTLKEALQWLGITRSAYDSAARAIAQSGMDGSTEA